MARQRHDVNLWVVPFKLSCAAVVLFAATLTVDLLAAYHVLHLPFWFTMGGIDDARAILGAMLGCVSTVLALIFSVTLLVLSMVANLFGPRLLYRFVQDWVTQVCIGLFMGAFIYVFLVFLVTHKDDHSTFIPQTCLITSWFVVLSAFAFLVFYSHRVALLIQNPDAIGRIVDDLRRVLKDTRALQPSLDSDATTQDHESVMAGKTCLVFTSSSSGYLQTIDIPNVLKAASDFDGFVQLYFRPGQFVLQGESLGRVYTAARHEEFVRQVEPAIALGRHRVLAQDFEFGIAQIVEVAIRALSPAVNDTFTGVACVDLLGEALLLLYTDPKSGSRWFDTQGTFRLQVRPVRLPRLVRQAFDQIRQAACNNPAVSIRLLTTMARLIRAIHNKETRQVLLLQAEATFENVNLQPMAELDRADVDAALRMVQQAMDEVDASIIEIR